MSFSGENCGMYVWNLCIVEHCQHELSHAQLLNLYACYTTWMNKVISGYKCSVKQASILLVMALTFIHKNAESDNG